MTRLFVTLLCLLVASRSYGQTAPAEIEISTPGGDMEFVWIEPGHFTMGTTADQIEHLASMRINGFSPWFSDVWSDLELPARQVVIEQGFYLGKYELTQDQWDGVMDESPWTGEPTVVIDSRRPASYLSWSDTQQLVGRLGEHIHGWDFRLPTDQEWEYACRAGATTVWYFGDDPVALDAAAWHRDNTEPAGLVAGSAPQPVGLKEPNGWGLHDMYGNVAEWSQTWIAADLPHEDHATPAMSGSGPTIRGGSFASIPALMRSAQLFASIRHGPDMRRSAMGARLVAVPREETAIAPRTWGRLKQLGR